MQYKLKKLVRSAQAMVPMLQEVRYSIHLLALTTIGRTWRPDVNALRFFDVESPQIVDIGANRGFSIYSFLLLKSKSRIIAFEPLSGLADILRVRYEKHPSVTIYACALGSADAQMTIYIPIYRGFMFDPLASLDYNEAANWINSDRFYFFNPEKLRIEKQNVKVSRLDDFCSRRT